MATIHYAEILEDFKADESGPAGSQRQAKATLKGLLESKQVRPNEFDFGKLWAEAYGWQAFIECRGNRDASAVAVMEAAGGTTTAAFQNISGQIIYGMVMETYQAPEYVFSRMIPTRQTNIDVEKIAGISDLSDDVAVVGEGELYPELTVGQQWRHAPLLRKRGFRVSLTREALFFDRTGQLQQKASSGGTSMGVNREKRAVDTVIDEGTNAISALLGGHRYHFLDNSISTFGNDSGNHSWDNLSASTGLVDWTDLDAVQQLLNEMRDPFTAEPIIFTAKHLVCAQSLELVALRIRNATEITVTTPGYATSGNPTETKVGNPFGGKFEVVTSPYVAMQAATDTDWWYGDITRAYEYVQAWPEEMKSLGSSTQLEFDKDITQQFRWSEYGNYSTKEPRTMVEANA